MTPEERLGVPTAPTAPPHGPVSTALRFVAIMTLIGVVCTAYFLLCLVLLPWRIWRLRLGNTVGGFVGRQVLRIAGIRYAVHGEDLNAASPAIYVQNHTGTLDLWLAMLLCPAPGSGTMKREILRVPLLGLGYLLSGHLLLHRGDTGRAIAAMDAIVKLVHAHRINIWILPEGTRSRDGRLLPFKKGFAHLALATRLPIVPVVVHGFGHRFWSHGLKVRPGTVQVEVLPAMSTEDWTREDLDARIADVEAVFAAALADHQQRDVSRPS